MKIAHSTLLAGIWRTLKSRLIRKKGLQVQRTLAGAPLEWRSFGVSADVHASAHDGGVALLKISTGRVFLCNQTGAQVWRALHAGVSPDAVCDEFSRDYGISRQLAEQHVSEFLVEMESLGIIKAQG